MNSKEEFVGFLKLEALDAKTTAKAIDDFVISKNWIPRNAWAWVSMPVLQGLAKNVESKQ